MSKIVAVVPVRKGSQRVKSKNTTEFHDTTLLDLKLNVLKNVKGLSRIIVNTDCEVCKDIAISHGVELYERDDYFASSNVTNDVHWRHIAEVTNSEFLMLAQTTSPMVRVSTYENAIKQFFDNSCQFDSVNSVSAEKKFLWKNGEPLNYDINKTPKSQDLPDIVSLNFAITIINKENMYSRGNVVGENPNFIELDRIESLDIDEQIDFEFAEFIYSKLGLEWLLK